MIGAAVDRVKRAWHRDLVADPRAHAWVLSLYRAGELYPDAVDDYFPVALAPWPWLAERMAQHHREERRHGAMFARAIKLSGEAVTDLSGDDVFNHVIRACTAATWRASPDDPDDAKRRALANFLAHAHHLELRVSRSLEFHLDACERAGADVAAKVVAAVLADELRHVSYTLDAARELVGRAEAAAIVAHHRDAEARANLLFSRRQVRTFLADFGGRAPPSHRALYRACAVVQALAAG